MNSESVGFQRPSNCTVSPQDIVNNEPSPPEVVLQGGGEDEMGGEEEGSEGTLIRRKKGGMREEEVERKEKEEKAGGGGGGREKEGAGQRDSLDNLFTAKVYLRSNVLCFRSSSYMPIKKTKTKKANRRSIRLREVLLFIHTIIIMELFLSSFFFSLSLSHWLLPMQVSTLLSTND